MKLGPFSIGKRKPGNWRKKVWKFLPVILALIIFCSFPRTFWGSPPQTSDESADESLPLPQDDKRFGLICPPGMCRIPQGILMGLRDMPLGVHIGDKQGWIVGNFGLGLKTEDGGKSWQRVTFPGLEEESFKDVFFVGEKGWIVGERGLILHTNDGGKSWNKQTSNGKSFLTVFFVDENKGFTAGSDGALLKTTNSGASWEVIDMGWETLIPEELLELGVVSINLYDIFFLTETLGWVVGDAGTVLRTIDGGKEWTLTQMAAVPPLFSVCFKNDRQGWAVGSHGFAQKTNDGGQSWEKFEIGTENSLYKIVLHDDYGIAVGDLATILKTVDGGKTWVEVPSDLPPPYPWFADACILPTNSIKVFTVGKRIIFNMGITSK